VAAAVIVGVLSTACYGWTLNPFSSSGNTTKKKTQITKVTKSEPSTLQKMGTGTKNFFDRTGETLGLKKPAPKKYTYANPQPLQVQGKKTAPSKSWLSSMFEPEEPKKPKTVTEWMGQPRRDL
jgi:hypothetical protein